MAFADQACCERGTAGGSAIFPHSMGNEALDANLLEGTVLIPHDAEVHPVTAVRNTVLQGSLALLRESGLYERYVKRVEPAVLQELTTNVAPCWVHIEVADAHYGACDAMAVSADDLESLGRAAGQLARKTSIVVAQPEEKEEFDLWQNAPRMHRVWKRLYQGGSVQIVKLGDTEELFEFRGFSLHRHRYYRYGCLAAIKAAHEAVGLHVEVLRIIRHDPQTNDTTFHLAWK
jgi:hypothetical protein